MTEVIDTTATEDTGWSGEPETDGTTYPEFPKNPANHRFTVSLDGRGPMVVVRGNTAEEIKAGYDELEESGFGAYAAAFWAGVQAAKNMAQGLGATPIPPAQQAPAQGFQQAPQGQFQQQGPPFGPNVSVPGAPGFMGQQGGFAPQQNFAPQGPQLPPGWYKLNVPFPQKGAFDGIVAQYNIQKGDPTRGGQVSFQKANKSWYCSPEVAQAFAQFSPTPA